MTNVLVNGSKGKMGKETVSAIQNEEDLNLVGESDLDDDLASLIKETNADVVVDFTHPKTVFENVKTILEAGAHAVVGTTGLSQESSHALNDIAVAQKKGLIICPNFAIGAVLMMTLGAKAAEYLPHVEIIEYHHPQKADAPSGTAIKTAELISERTPTVNEAPEVGEELLKGARGCKKKGIPIHSVRMQGRVADQDVILGGLGQTLTLSHVTNSREAFMPGVVLCVRKAISVIGLIYGLEKVLDL